VFDGYAGIQFEQMLTHFLGRGGRLDSGGLRRRHLIGGRGSNLATKALKGSKAGEAEAFCAIATPYETATPDAMHNGIGYLLKLIVFSRNYMVLNIDGFAVIDITK